MTPGGRGPGQLPGLDTAFLGLEAERQSGHVASLAVLDPSDLDVPFDLAHLRAVIEGRLPRIELFRKRLEPVALGLDRPYWVDDPAFDLDYHVRELALPRPGTREVLLDAVARLHERPLDLRRPLWEIYLVSGLERGRVAVYTKVHHAMLDGVSGVELLSAVVDTEPGLAPDPPEPYHPARAPSQLALVARAAGAALAGPQHAVELTRALVRYAPAMAYQAGPMLGRLLRRTPAGEDVAATPLRAPATPFTTRISAHRRIGLTRLPLDDLREIRTALGVSVNEVVLAVSAAAVRDWLQRHGGATSAPLVVMVPVALSGDRSGGSGNLVTAMFTPLPVHLADPLARLEAAHASSRAAKERGAAIPQELLEAGTRFIPPLLLTPVMQAYVRLGVLRTVRSFNTVVSNIPGPEGPLYYGGARVEAVYPLSIIVDGMGLNITLQGLGRELAVGVVGCREAVPDAQSIADAMLEEVAVLLTAVRARAADPG